MNLRDVNLLVYAFRSDSPAHERVRSTLVESLEHEESFFLPLSGLVLSPLGDEQPYLRATINSPLLTADAGMQRYQGVKLTIV